MDIRDKGQWKLRNVVGQQHLAALKETLAADDIEALVLRGEDILDEKSLFARVHEDLPHPSGRGVSADWTQLADSLWESLMLSESREFALLWLDSDRLIANGHLDHFLDAVDALQRLGRQLYSPSTPGVRGKTLYLFLLGHGDNYR